MVSSTVRPEEIPPVPENRFLMRRSPQAVQSSRDADNGARGRDRDRDRQREFVFPTTDNVQTLKPTAAPSFNLFLLSSLQLWDFSVGISQEVNDDALREEDKRQRSQGTTSPPPHTLRRTANTI